MGIGARVRAAASKVKSAVGRVVKPLQRKPTIQPKVIQTKQISPGVYAPVAKKAASSGLVKSAIVGAAKFAAKKPLVAAGAAYAVGKYGLGIGKSGGLVGMVEKKLGVNIPGLGYSAQELQGFKRKKSRRGGIHISAKELRTVAKVARKMKRIDKAANKVGYDVVRKTRKVKA